MAVLKKEYYSDLLGHTPIEHVADLCRTLKSFLNDCVEFLMCICSVKNALTTRHGLKPAAACAAL